MGRNDEGGRLEQALAEWRARHQVRDDDPILLLPDLLRLHSRHGGGEAGAGGVPWPIAAMAAGLAAVGGFLLGRFG